MAGEVITGDRSPGMIWVVIRICPAAAAAVVVRTMNRVKDVLSIWLAIWLGFRGPNYIVNGDFTLARRCYSYMLAGEYRYAMSCHGHGRCSLTRGLRVYN